MIELRTAIVFQSDLNPWIDICITVPGYEDFSKVEDVATKAYDEWFNLDTDECIGDYIENKLKENDLNFEMYIGYDKVCESEEQ